MEFKRRKWGWYLTLLSGKHFKVKILRFKAGGQTSTQKHSHRQELWCFLSGSGLLAIGKRHEDMLASSVEKGSAHHVKNWHRYIAFKPTTVLEIQYGSKCEEDDIERAP